MNDSTVNLVLVILSIGAVIVPVIGGCLMFKLSTYFMTKQEFTEFKKQLADEHNENREDIRTMQGDIKILIARKV